ncbi:MAG: hypothetical protein FWG15_07845 [Propionibacteriaceae bacterium]|nr:hypothetical protein [Propionibacteriaceae bacterium]
MNTVGRTAEISGTVTQSAPDGEPERFPHLVVAAQIDPSGKAPVWRKHRWSQIDKQGVYRIKELDPECEYALWVGIDPWRHSEEVDAPALLTTAHGGFATTSDALSDGDLLNPKVSWVRPGDPGEVRVDIPLVTGARISGRVLFVDGTPVTLEPHGGFAYHTRGSVTCVPEDGSDPIEHYLEADGKFSFVVIPGATYSFYAQVWGYPMVWRGGWVGPKSGVVPQGKIATITAPEGGQTRDGEDITLVAGSSISGVISGGDSKTWVRACAVYEDGGFEGVVETGVDESGAYILTGLIPGQTYIVRASCSGNWLTTWYGGYMGRSPRLPNDKVIQLVAPGVGECLEGIDVTLQRALTIVGTVYPPRIVKKTDVRLIACPVEKRGEQLYYRALLEEAPAGSPHQFPGGCANSRIYASSESGQYLLDVPPDVTYVVIALAEDYEDAWHGGYSGDSGIRVSTEEPYRPMPDSELITLVTGGSGSTVDNIDIHLGSKK